MKNAEIINSLRDFYLFQRSKAQRQYQRIMNFVKLLSPRRRQPLCRIISVSYSGQHPTRFQETQDYWRQKDDVSKRYQLIYKAPMERLLNYATTYLTFSTATVGILGAYYAGFVFDQETMETPVVLGDDIIIASSGIECFTYLGAFFAFHAAVKILLFKYVVRLYKDGDNYVAVFRGHMYDSIRKHEFHGKDIQKLSPTFVVTWGDARFSLGNKHAILLENYFKTPEYYNQLLNKKTEESSQEDQ